MDNNLQFRFLYDIYNFDLAENKWNEMNQFNQFEPNIIPPMLHWKN